jgi:hypothetical protein
MSNEKRIQLNVKAKELYSKNFLRALIYSCKAKKEHIILSVIFL